MQNDSLVGAGDAFSAAQPKSPPGDTVEEGEVVVAVGGHPDDIAHRQQSSAAGDADPGLVLEILQGGRDDDGDGQAVVLAEGGIAEEAAHDR